MGVLPWSLLSYNKSQFHFRKMRGFVLLAAVCQVSLAAPQFPFLTYAVPHAAVVTGNSVPVSVGGYKAVAGSNGDLAGPVHEVPGLVPALAVHKQESSGDVSLSTGTGALVPTYGVYYGKRSAEPQLLAHPYAYAAYPYALPVVKPLTLKTEVTATNLPVPLAVGTSAVLTHTLSKREAEADPAVLYSTVAYSHPAYATYAHHYPYYAGLYHGVYLG